MYLKSIEVQGFKSFANKTVFQFHNGITGIVGPNGSGKSNVADAVRWVLGEQRVKQLRGGSMQDVIFAGTQNRKPLGYACVSITLDIRDQALPVSYKEVTVTRRLYRSGESEYLLNGTQCRLKDVYELFYDTGIGKEGYSIIGQGQIEKILSGKPEERRELFDEAAGIVKFKRRKNEAQKKLENEQQSLLRINDILSELGRQLGPLERQAEKAKTYLKKREELKVYDVNLFLTELEDASSQLQELQQSWQISNDELEDTKNECEKNRLRYEEVTSLLEKMRQEQTAFQEEATGERLEKGRKENQVTLLQEQIRTARGNVEERKERLKNLGSEKEENNRMIEEVQSGREALLEQLGKLKEQERVLAEKQTALADSAKETEYALESSRQAVLSILENRSTVMADKQRLETMKDQNRIRKAELSKEYLQLKSEEKDQAGILKEITDQCRTLQAELDSLSEQSSMADQELAVIQEELSRLNEQVEKDQQTYHREASRLETLRNLAERYDGYGNSIRRVMEQKKTEKGICGVVADLIRTQPQYETAIETALGAGIQNIVTEDEETAKRLIGFLKKNRYGRATFLPLNAMKNAPVLQQDEALAEPGVIGLASQLVETDSRYRGVVRSLLGRTIVADDIDSAVKLARKYHYRLRIVTLEGESLSPGGSMTGGAFKNSSNLLGRRREIDELKEAVSRLRDTLEEEQDAIDLNRGERNRLRDLLRGLSGKMQEKYLEQNTANIRRQELENRSETTKAGEAQLEQEMRDADRELKDLEEEHSTVLAEIEGSVKEEENQKKLQDQLQETLAHLREEENDCGRQLEQLHIETAGLDQKEQFLRQEKTRLENRRTDLQEEERILSESGDQALSEIENREKQITGLKEEICRISEDIEEIERQLEVLRSEQERKSREQKTFFDRREELAEKEALLDKETFRLHSRMEKITESRDSRIAYMWEEYELTPEDALTLRRTDIGGVTSWKRNMAALRREIRDLGNVNVNSIEEYKEVSERHAFMTAQQEDLIKAEDALRKIIRELDTGMRQQFRDQFARIQEEFDHSFRELFGGGRGTLELVEEEDILEAGIRIIAQPPGKKLQNMMQLSGGEKALTAIALLFAIQNLKPSPFCLLDEIEAALDENNVERYAEYLHKLTKHTQFIIITHRRGTMAAADRLYGVTMQEKGISALVSVNLIESQLDA